MSKETRPSPEDLNILAVKAIFYFVRAVVMLTAKHWIRKFSQRARDRHLAWQIAWQLTPGSKRACIFCEGYKCLLCNWTGLWSYWQANSREAALDGLAQAREEMRQFVQGYPVDKIFRYSYFNVTTPAVRKSHDKNQV